MIKLIVAGGRDFNNYSLMDRSINNLIFDVLGFVSKEQVEIVSGGAIGADNLGEWYARKNDLQLKVFKPDWDRYSKAAGFIRNVQMADYADMLIAFWDGKSRGTEHMIQTMKRKEKYYKVIKY